MVALIYIVVALIFFTLAFIIMFINIRSKGNPISVGVIEGLAPLFGISEEEEKCRKIYYRHMKYMKICIGIGTGAWIIGVLFLIFG